MKVRKTFTYKEIELRIVEREEDYMNNPNAKMTMTRVLAPNGGSLPLQLNKKDSLKSIVDMSTTLLKSFEDRGANIKEELTKEIFGQ